MNKSFVVDSTFVDMRLDRFLRNKLGNLPQSLIEKNLRNGKIKLNKKYKIQQILPIMLFFYGYKKKWFLDLGEI